MLDRREQLRIPLSERLPEEPGGLCYLTGLHMTRTNDLQMNHLPYLRLFILLLPVAGCAPGDSDPAGDYDGIVRTALHDFRVEEVADGLVRPFAMAFTPEGDLLVTERPGRLRIIRDGVLRVSQRTGSSISAT